MPSTEEILTELAKYVIDQVYESLRSEHPVEIVKRGSKIETAIANAAEQIRQQERDRVEKLKTLIVMLARCLPDCG